MTKWADFLISGVNYNSEHQISTAIRHRDTAQGISTGKPIDRLTIASDIKNGFLYITIYGGQNSWKKGHKIHAFSLSGNPFLRIDKNKVPLDFLGDLPEIPINDLSSDDLFESQPEPAAEDEEATPEQLARLEQLEKQIQELESQPAPAAEIKPASPRGSLPKTFPTELSQELESQPEPAAEDEEATPEQLARLEQLEKQIQELESQPEPAAEDEEATPEQLARLEQLEKQIQELESQPEPAAEDEEATPESLMQLDDLQKQIQELENTLSSQNLPQFKSHNSLSNTESLMQLDDLQKQIQELENTLLLSSNPSLIEELSKTQELDSEIIDLESNQPEYEIIEKLEKQNKKLDDLEKKLRNSPKTKSN